MAKKYARIYPAWQWTFEGCRDLPLLCVAPFHYFFYESIGGYSLGHTMDFFESLEEAKEVKFSANNYPQFAVIEFETIGEGISLQKIHEFEKYETASPRAYQYGLFSLQKTPIWKEKNISAKDLTKGALELFTQQYRDNTKTTSLHMS